MGVVKGLSDPRQNAFITVDEAGFMQRNKDGIPYFRSDVGSDGNGLSNPQNWTTFRPDGRLVEEASALVGDEGVITRDFKPQYRLMEHVLRQTSGLPISDTQIDGGTRRKLVFIDPENATPAIESITGYYGGPDGGAARLRGGKLRAWNIDTRRGADGGSVSGGIDYHFNAYEPNIWIPGASAHNTRIRFNKNGATVGGVFRVSVYTGAVGNAETKRIIATNTTGNGTFILPDTPLGGGGQITVTAGMTAADLQIAIRALPGYNNAGVVVTGTTTAGTADLSDGKTATGGYPNPGYLIDNNLATFPTIGAIDAPISVDIGAAPGTTTQVRLYCGVVGNLAHAIIVDTSVIGDFTDAVQQVNVPCNTLVSNAWNTFVLGAPIAARYWRIRLGAPPGASANWLAEMELLGSGGAGNGFYDVALGGGLALVDVADWPSSGGNGWTSITQIPFSVGGWSSSLVTISATGTTTHIKNQFQAATGITAVTVTRRGGTGAYDNTLSGEFEVLIDTPAQTRIFVEKVSGPKWVFRQLAFGSTGNELVYVNSPYLEPDHWRAYLATNDSDLNTINMDDMPDDDGLGGDIHLLRKITGFNMAWSDLVKPHYTGNQKKFATDFVAGARALALAVILPNNPTEGSDADWLYRTQEGCSATGFWLRRAWGCGGYEMWEDFFVGRREAMAFEIDNDVQMRTFPLGRRRNPQNSGSMRTTLILPN